MEDIFGKPTKEQWLRSLRLCEAKAVELKYEVAVFAAVAWPICDYSFYVGLVPLPPFIIFL